MNRVNVEKVLKAIKRARAERVIMNFISKPARKDNGRMSCGTAYCIAGWTCHVSESPYGLCLVDARCILGLDARTASLLFTAAEYGNNYDSVRKKIIDLAEFDRLPAKVRKQAAINVLERLLKTGKVNWKLAVKEAKDEYAN